MGGAGMKVFILAGGLGTRIRSLFPDRPKALIPFKGKPFLEYQLQLLAEQGFHHFVLCLGYMAEQIIHYFGDGAKWGINIEYSIEESPLGTAGALKFAAPFFRETSLVLNGDTYLRADYQALIAYHREQVKRKGAVGTLVVVEVKDTARYGRVVIDEDGRVIEFQEKAPSPHNASLINAGIYVFEPYILNYIPSGRSVSLEEETFPAILAAGEKLYGFPVKGTFVDIGTPEGYYALKRLLL
jgi:NDP-sugar pyrophosphorylase family protein